MKGNDISGFSLKFKLQIVILFLARSWMQIYIANTLAIFAVILEQVQSPGIRDAEWDAKDQREQLSEMRACGKTLFESTKPKLETVVAAASSQDVLNSSPGAVRENSFFFFIFSYSSPRAVKKNEEKMKKL